MASKTPGQRIAESVYYLDDGETYASVEGKRSWLAKKIDAAIEQEVLAQRKAMASSIHAFISVTEADDENKYGKKPGKKK